MTALRANYVFAIAAVVHLVLLASISGYFSHDELEWLNRATSNSLPWVRWMDFSPLQYRPLTFNVWLVVDCLIGDRPWLQHSLFALWGIANAGLLFRMLRCLGADAASSAFASGVFLWLPNVIYTHGWVATAADLLCLSLLLLAALRLTSESRDGFGDAMSVIVTTLAALASKESAIVFPALLLGLAAAGADRPRVLRAVVVSGACVAAYLSLRWNALLHAPRDGPLYTMNLGAMPTRWLEYFLFPFVPPLLESGIVLQKSLARLLLAAALHLALCFALLRAGRAWLATYLALFTAALGPVLILGASANHYAYLASAAACAVIGFGWPRFDQLSRRLAGIAIGVALIHSVVIGFKLREIGAMQTRFFASIAEIQHIRPGRVLRVGVERPADAWLLQRWLLAGGRFRDVAVADRLVFSDAGDAELRMHSDGNVNLR